MSYNLFLSSSSAVGVSNPNYCSETGYCIWYSLLGLKKTCSGMYYILLGNNTSNQVDEKNTTGIN